jgi:thiamine-phosphate diphosphorylase
LETIEQLRIRPLLYFVLDPEHVLGSPMTVTLAAIRGGITALQLRCKNGRDRSTLELAKSLREVCVTRGVLFIVNDRVDIALAARADGVHLGVDDLPLEHARELGGPTFVLGYSPETDEQTRQAAKRGASYLGVGPVFATATKPDAGNPIGLAAISHRAANSGIPVIAIGGITAANAPAVVEAGACGVAVVSAIAGAPDPESAVRQFRIALAR